MKKLLFILLTILLFALPKANNAQAPALGTAADFVLFTTNGAVTNTGIPYQTVITGNAGTNSSPTISGFGNINGQLYYSGSPESMQCATDLNTAYLQLDAAVPTFFPPAGLGGGQILMPGVHYVSSASVLSGDLILDGQNDSSSVFIIQIEGTFSTNPDSKVKLINDAMACNVFWMVEGAVSMGTGTTMRGTIIANNGAITMTAGDTLEGRALTTSGAIQVEELFAYTPVGCNSAVLSGPVRPTLGAEACFGIFTSVGTNTSVGFSEVEGDVGSNTLATLGYIPLLVTGTIHTIPDATTATTAADLANTYTYLNGLPEDIILLEPALFGHNLILTPHTYLLPSSVTFTDTVFLDAQGEPDAVFVIKVDGSFTTSTFSHVMLLNGANPAHVFWNITGAVSINDFSIFNGTIIADGAIILATGVELTGRALTINGAIGVIDVIVTNPSGGPGISIQPTDQTVCLGDEAVFTVGGGGTYYQWRRGSVNLVDGANISGSNTSTLTIDPVAMTDMGNDYNVIVGRDCVGPDTSINVSLILETSPSIITQPSDQIVCVGDSTGFVVVATGSNLTYQWRKGSVNLVNGGNISGVDNDTLFINPAGLTDAANDYNVVITGSCGPAVTSINVELIVNPLAVITDEPADVTACIGDSTGFVVVAAGNNLTYQWRKGLVDLVDGGNISGANNDTLIINPAGSANASNNYHVIVSGGCSTNDTSIMVSLVIEALPAITTQPSDQIACVGDSIAFVVAATGSGLTYQWRKGSVDLVNGGNISGVHNDTLLIDPAGVTDSANDYNVVITGSCGSVTSNDAELIVYPVTSITGEPIDATVCIGDSTGFVVVATGNNLTYQWVKGTVSLVDGGNISGATNDTLIFEPAGSADASNNYHVIVSSGCPLNDTSIMASLIIEAAPSITTQPSDQIACVGDPIAFVVTATGSNLTYQWRRGSVNLVNGGNISGVHNDTLLIDPAGLTDAANDYNVVITGSCGTITSNNAELFVYPVTSITSEPIDVTVCVGDSAGFVVVATGNNLTYQWRRGTVNLINGPNISGATNDTLIIDPVGLADASANYNVIVSSDCPTNDISVMVSLIVNSPVLITAEPNDDVVCEGTSAVFSVTATGSNLTYQWRKGSANIANGGNISGATTATLTINPVALTDAALDYNVIVSGACPMNDTSVNAELEVNVSPVSAASGNPSICMGDSLNLFADTIAGGSYSWTSANGYSSTDQNPCILNASASNSGTYSLVVTANGCSSLPSDVRVTVDDCTDFFIPEGFSPNGDGINDLFVVRGIDDFPENTMLIYNRWGDKVFEATPYMSTWNGNSQTGIGSDGDVLPVGTYFYVLDLGDGSEVYRGTIYLNQ